MGLETAFFVAQLDEQNPRSFDMMKEGDDHLKLIKIVLKATFPNFDERLEFSAGQLNRLYQYTFSGEDEPNGVEVKNFTVISQADFKDIINFPQDEDDVYVGDIQGLADIQFTTEEGNDPDAIPDDKRSRALSLGTAEERYVRRADEEGIKGGITKLVFDGEVVAEALEDGVLQVHTTVLCENIEVEKELTVKTATALELEVSSDLKVGGKIFRGSDRRIKSDIKDLDVTVDALRPVSYFKNEMYEFGVVAQELPEEYQHLVSDANGENILSVDYTQFIPVLIKEIQTLKKEISTLKGVAKK